MVSVIGFVFLFVAVFFIVAAILNDSDPWLSMAAVVCAGIGGWLVSIGR